MKYAMVLSTSRQAQSGAVLIVALILLMVLTILGVSSMTTTSLGEKMAANSQDRSRAMQAADSGVNRAFRQIDTVNVINAQTGGSPVLNYGSNSSQNAGAYYVARHVGTTIPPVSSGAGADTYGVGTAQAYYFDIQSTGGSSSTATPAGVTSAMAAGNTSSVIVNGGIYQIVVNSN